MHTLRWIFLVALVALSVLPLRAKEASWLKLRSEHFEIYSAENEKKARKVLEHLERVRKAFGILTNVTITSEDPVRVVLFRNEKEYREVAPDTLSAAYYSSARGRDHIVLSDFDTQTERILNHEYFHLFSKHAGFHFPVWLEEGLADFYSTLEITSKEVAMAHPIANHILFLNSYEGRPIPLSMIAQVTHENRHGGDKRATGLLYAEGWALTHMTFQGEEMRPRADQFFKLIRNGEVDTATAYRTVYGVTLEELDKKLANYVRRATYYYGKSPAEGLNFDAPVEAAPLEDWEAPLLLADLLAFTRKTEQAETRYGELSQQFPDRPEVDESRAFTAWQSGNRSASLPSFREAAKKKSTNPEVYFHLASGSCNYSLASEECTAWINECLRLKPDHKLARQWAIGYALNTRQFQNAILYMARAGRVTPEDAPRFFEQMAYAHYHLNDFRQARAAAKRGLEFAKHPTERTRLEALSKIIDQAEQARNGTPATLAQAQTTSDGASGDAGARGDGASQMLTRRDEAPQPAPSAEKQSDADRAIEQFILQEGSSMTAATMESLECKGPSPVLVVKSKSTPLRLVIDNPTSIYVVRNGELIVDYEFTCGPQKSETLLVGYVKEGAPEGADGLLRILSFR